MQVRKFEAKSIKEAIELVKFHLGPDAIILSAKDNSKSFGLMGESSVEVTAAVSDKKLVQKKMAEAKLNTHAKQQYQTATAKMQKKFIEKSYNQAMDDAESKRKSPPPMAPLPKRNGITTARYIDIDENGEILPANMSPGDRANDSRAMQPSSRPQPSNNRGSADEIEREKIQSLQNEIFQLRKMLNNFQTVPQNFVTMHPGAEDGIPFELSFAYKKLQDAGIAIENIVPILKRANEVLPIESKRKRAFVDGWLIKYFLDNLAVVEKPLKSKFQIFVGPTGQGKTSTIVKLACHAALKERKKIAVLSGDYVKVGASDQLKIYCQILNVPCGTIGKWQDWNLIQKTLEGFDYVFVDTPGVNLRSPQDLETLKSVLPPQLNGMQIHYVQSAMARDADALEVAERFKVVGFDDVIFTRIDEAVQHGLIFNFQKKFNTAVHSFGIGNSVPDDFEFATKERIVDLIFNLSNFKKERGS